MLSKTLKVRRLGRLEYGEAYRIQKETELAVRRGEWPDTLLLVEHPHVITRGRRAERDGGILAAPETLAERGVAVFETNRGGKMTYHGLGQLVGYPIINLSPDREDVHQYVRDLEETLVRALGDFGIEGFTVEGLTGVHTSEGKVAAIGIHIARWVTTHGFALNINTDLGFFDLIVPCEGEPVASLKGILGRQIPLGEVEDRLIARFAEVFEMTPEEEESGVRSPDSGAGERRTPAPASDLELPAPDSRL
ncbi:MAG: lipoyl(octanoyl) transferase LipB [Acidobacteria bacterium]|nr:lipoyl(octanoyl) transferase LipB [Acidobacteriota bacterium]